MRRQLYDLKLRIEQLDKDIVIDPIFDNDQRSCKMGRSANESMCFNAQAGVPDPSPGPGSSPSPPAVHPAFTDTKVIFLC